MTTSVRMAMSLAFAMGITACNFEIGGLFSGAKLPAIEVTGPSMQMVSFGTWSFAPEGTLTTKMTYQGGALRRISYKAYDTEGSVLRDGEVFLPSLAAGETGVVRTTQVLTDASRIVLRVE